MDMAIKLGQKTGTASGSFHCHLSCTHDALSGSSIQLYSCACDIFHPPWINQAIPCNDWKHEACTWPLFTWKWCTAKRSSRMSRLSLSVRRTLSTKRPIPASRSLQRWGVTVTMRTVWHVCVCSFHKPHICMHCCVHGCHVQK